jgi:hypothetical protein
MTLNLNPEGSSTKKTRNYKKALRVGGAVSLVGIGSTFAANISLNQGANVEFGQGVAQTAACDADGFSITPVTSYDNEHSIFRVDRIDITGLNLTPVGTGYSAGGYNTQDEAKTAHPGQYYDNGWKRTCDGVVLDFAAYTDDVKYASYTLAGYSDITTTSTSTPVAWSQYNGQGQNSNFSADSYNPGFAVIFDTSDTNDSYLKNYATASVPNDTDGAHYYSNSDYNNRTNLLSAPWMMNVYNLQHGDQNSVGDASNSSFSFGSNYSNRRPNAASISKITVSSMKYFANDYYDVYTDGNGGDNIGLAP